MELIVFVNAPERGRQVVRRLDQEAAGFFGQLGQSGP